MDYQGVRVESSYRHENSSRQIRMDVDKKVNWEDLCVSLYVCPCVFNEDILLT